MTVDQIGTSVLLVWNSLVFLLYGLDKGRARKGLYRISEKTLLNCTLFLGGVGAVLGGYFFHHKTRKWYFQAAWFVGVGIDVFILYLIWWR